MYNFDPIVAGALSLAQTEALKRKNPELTTQHFLWGLIHNPASISVKKLKGQKANLKAALAQQPTLQNLSMAQLRPSSQLSEWITYASSEAIKAKRAEVAEADFLKHLSRFFPEITLDMNEEEEEQEVPAFLTNLNELAEQGKLDPVIGRAQEIRKVQEILCRRTKNNPVLVGPPGVGKTVIIEGLAGLIVAKQVPDTIQGRTVYALDMGTLMAGTKYRGDFEERIQQLLKFLKKQGRDVILFIDEVHLIIGAGKGDGAMDAANLLKPALARGELNAIGATTLTEYKKYIESDSALERRFHMVRVDEPSVEGTIQILLGLREKLEIHHGIAIGEDAIIAAATLSNKYVHDRFLPDKAIDLVDEAAAGLKLSAESLPPELMEMNALLRSKKILAEADKDNASLKAEIAKLEKEYNEKNAVWDKKNSELRNVAHLKSTLDQVNFQLKKAEQEGNFAEASRLKYGELPKLTKELEKHAVAWKLTRNDIAQVLARATGIPKQRILASQQQNILQIYSQLRQVVFGQDQALQEISEVLITTHAGLGDESRPMGSFLLLGPSGVGKTETAKALARYLFDSEKKMVRLDLSEYSERHAVAKLIGAPPGYIGYEKGGILTEAIRRQPYAVLLMDEIEKAHPDFADILLQILDDGRLTDTQGRSVDFRNTIIFITSNLKNYEDYLKPELIGRIDQILQYNPLDQQAAEAILARELAALNKQLATRKVEVTLAEEARQRLLATGIDAKYGARPLRRIFQRIVVRPLASLLLQEGLQGDYMLVIADDGALKMIKKG